MNTSNAFSDYMVTYSVNRSVNFSPTSGRLHRNSRDKSSYGPTICLLNRSRDKNNDSSRTEIKDEGLIAKIFMLSLEVDRLSQQLRQAKMQVSEAAQAQRTQQMSRMREEKQRLEKSSQRYEIIREQQQLKFNAQLNGCRHKIEFLQEDKRRLERQVTQKQREIEDLLKRGKQREEIADRAKMEASRLETSLHYNSTNVDLHKSIAREKGMEAQILKDRLVKCEQVVHDQRVIIGSQKQDLSDERMRRGEVEAHYNRQIDQIKEQLDNAHREGTNRANQASGMYLRQLGEWQGRVEQKDEQIKEKGRIIAQQVNKINQQEETIADLQRRISELQFSCHSRVVRAEQATKLAHKEKDRQLKKINQEVQEYIHEVASLKASLDQHRASMAQKDDQVQRVTSELSGRLKEREKMVRRLNRRNKEQLEETKLNKSLSVDNSMVTNQLRSSQVNLTQIVSSVEQLRKSNDRTRQLFSKNAASAKSLYYAQ